MQPALRGALPLLAVALIGRDVVGAQDRAPTKPTIGPLPEQMGAARSTQEEDLHAELENLIREIEGKLNRIDIELADAGAGVAPAGQVEDAGISDLLRSSLEKSEWVVGAIDRIFEIRDHHSGGT